MSDNAAVQLERQQSNLKRVEELVGCSPPAQSDDQAATQLQSVWRGREGRRKSERRKLDLHDDDDEEEETTAAPAPNVARFDDQIVAANELIAGIQASCATLECRNLTFKPRETRAGVIRVSISMIDRSEAVVLELEHLSEAAAVLRQEVARIQQCILRGQEVKMVPEADPMRLFFKQMFELAEGYCPLKKLAYGNVIDYTEQQLPLLRSVAPFDQVGTLNVSWQPVFTNDDTEEQPVVTDPMTELVGRPWSARVEIKGAFDLDLTCDHGHIQYVFCGEVFSTMLSTNSGTSPEFNYSYTHHVPVCSIRFVEYLMQDSLNLELCLIQRLPPRDLNGPSGFKRSESDLSFVSAGTADPGPSDSLWYNHPGVAHFARFCKGQLRSAKASQKGFNSRPLAVKLPTSPPRLRTLSPMGSPQGRRPTAREASTSCDWDGEAKMLADIKALCPVADASPDGESAAEAKPCLPGDVTIYLAEEETVVAHSFILSLRSPVLRAQLATGADELHLPDVSKEMFLKVVQYLYSGKVTLREMGATIELFKLADQLQIVQLQAFTSRHVTSLRQLEFPQWRNRVKHTIEGNLGPAELQPAAYVASIRPSAADNKNPQPKLRQQSAADVDAALQILPSAEDAEAPGVEGSASVENSVASSAATKEQAARRGNRVVCNGREPPSTAPVMVAVYGGHKLPSAYEGGASKLRPPLSAKRFRGRKHTKQGRKAQSVAALESFYAPSKVKDEHDRAPTPQEEQVVQLEAELAKMTREVERLRAVVPAQHRAKLPKPASASKMRMSQVYSVRSNQDAEVPKARGALLDGVLATTGRSKASHVAAATSRTYTEPRLEPQPPPETLVAGIMTGERRQWTTQIGKSVLNSNRGSLTAR